jgi:hypothetical protein
LLDEADVPEVDEEVSETRCEMQAEEIDEAEVFETRYETPADEMPADETAGAELLGTRSEMPAGEGEDGSPTE